jgi:hypothetical protein
LQPSSKSNRASIWWKTKIASRSPVNETLLLKLVNNRQQNQPGIRHDDEEGQARGEKFQRVLRETVCLRQARVALNPREVVFA